MNSLVSSEWLLAHLSDPNLIILDASTAKNVQGIKSAFDGICIKNARKINKNDFSDKASVLPNTMIDADTFELEARKLGISADSKIVVYDNLGIYTSPRVWWMLRLMGHQEVSVLDGGLPDWVDKGFPCEDSYLTFEGVGDFEANYQPQLYRSLKDIQLNLESKNEMVIDARSEDRFYGIAPEPRPNLKSGHIPYSKNIHFTSVLENGKVKNTEDLKVIFEDVTEEPLVFTCGSGTTACILMLAAEQVMDNSMAVYDGSWTEWGSKKGCEAE